MGVLVSRLIQLQAVTVDCLTISDKAVARDTVSYL